MPAVQIEVRQHYDLEIELALMDAVHSALVEAFKIPQHDRNIRLFVHEPHHFLCPTDKSQPEYFTSRNSHRELGYTGWSGCL